MKLAAALQRDHHDLRLIQPIPACICLFGRAFTLAGR